MACALPQYSKPSCTHLTSLLWKKHADRRKLVHDLLREAEDVSLTTDGWTSAAQESYATYTTRFLDENWRIQSFVLETIKMPGAHTPKAIRERSLDAARRAGLRNVVVQGAWKPALPIVCRQQLPTLFCDIPAVVHVLACVKKLVGHFKHSCKATEALLE